jgi:glycosyltransferase involved in cell wall biosynthesis
LTGNPVVVTKVGDIPLFLKDGESALLADADDTQAFAEKLCWALEHPVESAKTGECGRDVAMKCFNSYSETQKIIKAIGIEHNN